MRAERGAGEGATFLVGARLAVRLLLLCNLLEPLHRLRVARRRCVRRRVHHCPASPRPHALGARDRRDPRLLLRGGQLLVERRRASVAALPRLEWAVGAWTSLGRVQEVSRKCPGSVCGVRG